MAPATATTFFGFKAEKIVKRAGKADVYVFSTGMERSKGADVIAARDNPKAPEKAPAPPSKKPSR